MPWFSALTSLNNNLLNDGEILAKYDETFNLAFQSILKLSHFGVNTPRICFLKAMRKVLGDMAERIWNFESEMEGWELGDRPDLLPDNEDDELHNEWDLWTTDLGVNLEVDAAICVHAEERECRWVQITSEKEENTPERSNDKDKFRMVVKRLADENRVESFSCIRREPKARRISGHQIPEENGRTCPML